jgi:hypothetical protein
MTPQEIINEIQKLPPAQKKEIIDSVSQDNQTMSEDEFEQLLFAEGIIGNIPNLDEYTDEDEDFEPIKISGKPTSEIVIEDRG